MANNTVVGTLELASAFENIGVISPFSGDDNGDNHAVLEYRRVGISPWQPGINMTVDRRELIHLSDKALPESGTIVNRWKNQWRAVIFWLEPNTEYEVRVTYTDPDGVVGSDTVVGGIWTRDDNPPSIGRTFYVALPGNDVTGDGSFANPWRTIQHAADSGLLPGDTVSVMGGIWNEEVIITVSGIATNFITIQSYDLDNKAVIDGQKLLFNNFFLNNASFIRLKGFGLRNVEPAGDNDRSNVLMRYGSHDNFVEDCDIYEMGTTWRSGGVEAVGRGGGWSDEIDYDSYNITVQRCVIRRDSPRTGEPSGVYFYRTQGGHVVRNNKFIGNFKDFVSGGANDYLSGGLAQNSFVHDNTMIGGPDTCWDDAIEAEGAEINCAIWGNTIVGVTNFVYGIAPVQVGPLYIFRDEGWDIIGGVTKIGGFRTTPYEGTLVGDSFGFVKLYHLTFKAGYGVMNYGTFGVQGNQEHLNNIFYTTAGYAVQVLREVSTPMFFDYNLFYVDSPTASSIWWWDSKYGMSTYDEWRTKHGQQLHGLYGQHGNYPSVKYWAEPDWVGFVDLVANDFRLRSDSPARDAGVILPGFNDENSPWPYTGAAPDMGAIETGQLPVHTLTISSGLGGTTNPPPGSYDYELGSVIAVTAIPDSDYQFLEWQEAGVAIGTNNPITILVDTDRDIMAIFTEAAPPPDEYVVSIVTIGGGTTNPPTGDYNVVEGETLDITAIPGLGWLLDHWEGDISSTELTISFPVMSNMTVTAVFTEIPTYALTVSSSPGGTTIPAPGTHGPYEENSQVPISAVPDSDYLFLRWEEAGVEISTDMIVNVLMDRDRSIHAVFEAIPPQDTVVSITITGPGMTIPGPGDYDATVGETMDILATPDAGYRFDHWEGDISGTQNPISFTVTANMTIIAVFSEKAPPSGIGVPLLISGIVIGTVATGIILARPKRR